MRAINTRFRCQVFLPTAGPVATSDWSPDRHAEAQAKVR
jgi:hypothetical protein